MSAAITTAATALRWTMGGCICVQSISWIILESVQNGLLCSNLLLKMYAIGEAMAAQYGVPHLPADFKKRNGYLRSLQLSAEYGLYRQDYCGCEFSARARQP